MKLYKLKGDKFYLFIHLSVCSSADLAIYFPHTYFLCGGQKVYRLMPLGQVSLKIIYMNFECFGSLVGMIIEDSKRLY